MRVLVIPTDFPFAANPQAGIFILRRLQALRDLGHEMRVLRIVPLAPPIGEKWKTYRSIPSFEAIEGFPVHTVRTAIPPRLVGMEYRALQLRGALRREIEAFRPDLVHADYLIPGGHTAVQQPLPTVVTMHGIDAYDWPFRRSGLRRAARETLRRATCVVAVSEYLAQCVQRIAATNVRVIWNSADETIFYPRDRRSARESLGLPQDAFIVAFAGNLLRDKGTYELIEAVSSTPGAARTVVALAGAGPELDGLKEHAHRNRVDARFLGRLDHDVLAQLYGAADVVALPSYYEGLPVVVVEAMLSQRAVLATPVGGVPEIIEPGVTGVLVPPRSASELSRALARLQTDADLRDRIAARALAFAGAHLTASVSARKYDELYQEIVGRHSLHRKDASAAAL